MQPQNRYIGNQVFHCNISRAENSIRKSNLFQTLERISPATATINPELHLNLLLLFQMYSSKFYGKRSFLSFSFLCEVR